MMTPGFAKSRQELFWLPYPEPDRVIINAHNFTPSPTFSVNGKAPISVWCPSKDDTGNGTTSLLDLVGSNDGTLTNMDAATDWVSDTDAGGVRALDFDGSNDYVTCGDIASFDFGTGAFSIAFWMKAPNRNANWNVIAKDVWTLGTTGLLFYGQSGSPNTMFYYSGAERSFGAILDNTWKHVAITRAGTGANQTKAYLNGSLILTFQDARTLSNSYAFRIGIDGVAFGPYLGRLEDLRVWGQSLDLADIEYLYNSGSGRGRTS